MALVLVADDILEVRRRICLALEEIGEETLEAADGREALEVVRTRPVSLVVSDVRMPNLGGLALLRALGEDAPPVILHSGYADVAAAVEGLRLGAADFFSAPLDLQRLRRAARSCLDRRNRESALFGHERGAFTGASSRRRGLGGQSRPPA